MAILVTGGNGYIGRWLAHELLAHDLAVVTFDRLAPDPSWRPPLPASARFVSGDITDRDAVVEAARGDNFSAIVHLAGIVTMGCERDPDLGMRVNLGGTHNVLEAARLCGIPRVVFASTISVYGPDVSQPMTESTAALPLTWYGQSKLMAEQLGLYYRRRFGLDFRASRLAAIVGPARNAASGSATMYTSLIIERAALGQPYEIDVDPEAGTPVCYAKDAARALATLATAASAPRQVYHISTGLVTARSLIDIVRKKVPNAQITFRPDPLLAPVSRISRDWDLSIAAAEQDLGWRPAYTIETMVDDLMAIVRSSASAGQ
ncbi:MAG TPA: NAD(P)-dependent oxidoreductase [Chloroflexota bacterium]|nr:NAD(P)-dependent oxidoreductase [Chloroflexota bacterium]